MRPQLMELDTPSVVIDVDVMEGNLSRMAELCRQQGKDLRPHTKTHKTPEIARRQVELGASGITVAKLGEAEVMAEHEFDEILLAYELIGDHKIRRLVDLLKRKPSLCLTVAVDTLPGASGLSNAGVQTGRAIPVLIEIDTGLGRTGVGSTAEAVSLARHIRLFPGIKLAGILTHEGHIGRDGGPTMEERALQAAALMTRTAAAIREIGMECPVVSMGSTPAARFLAGAPGITELRPGTYVFNDRTQIQVGAATEAECALTVLSTVISVQPGRRAVLDAGSKVLTSDATARFGSFGDILGDPGAKLAVCSEEHGHLDLSGSTSSYQVGDRMHVLPNHVCPVVNLVDQIYGYQGDAVVRQWRVAARGRVL